MFKHCLTTALLAAALVTGCNGDDNPAPAASGPTAGLTLATLPAGWKYEGWAVINGTPVSTGTFTSASAADDSAPFSGATAGPPFPGEDFLQNAPSGLTFPTELQGTAAVISIEPSPDDSTAPFTLKPLTAMVPAGAADHVAYPMSNGAAVFPTGTATISGTTLTLAFTGLEPLLNGYYYEGWAIISSSPVSTGHFNVNSSGQLITHPGGVVIPNGDFTGIANLASATAIVITIEPINDPDPLPAATHILAGDVSGATASLTVGHAAALGNTFATAAGTYILATPTDGTGTPVNERSGVWFLNP